MLKKIEKDQNLCQKSSKKEKMLKSIVKIGVT